MTQNKIKILAIETSCDETSAAVIEDGKRILSNIISSQRDTHSLYGGVVPEIASREHLKLLVPVVEKSLALAGVELDDIDALAVTRGPGLVGPLLVGLSYAKALSYAKRIPIIPLNHIKCHIYANFLEDSLTKNQGMELEFPLMALVVSGGHSDIIYLKSHHELEIVGETLDDAAGEAFDKIARALDLGYPGGPEIDKLAREGKPKEVEFPRATLKERSYDFSFSGLKSAVLNYLNQCKMKNEPINKEDIALGFQQSVIDQLVTNTLKACKERQVEELLIAGGVSANSALREEFKERAEKKGIRVSFPPPILCTDNAAMVGACGYWYYVSGRIEKIQNRLDLNAVPNLSLEDN